MANVRKQPLQLPIDNAVDFLASFVASGSPADRTALETIVFALEKADLTETRQQELFVHHLGALLPRFSSYQSWVMEKLKGKRLPFPPFSNAPLDLAKTRNFFIGLYRLVSLNRSFTLLWDWTELLTWFQARDPHILWCVIEVFSIVGKISESAKISLKQNLKTNCDYLTLKENLVDEEEKTLLLSSSTPTIHTVQGCDGNVAAVNIGNVLLPASLKSQSPGDFICTPSISNTLFSMAISVAAKRPVLLEGPIGCGKSALVQHLACLTGRLRSPDLIQLQLGGFTDAKALVGVYQATDIPGEFVWSPGVLCEAMSKGYWLLLEDINSAPAELGSILLSVLESRVLVLLGQGTTLRAAPGFQLFATHRSGKSMQMELLADHWDAISVKEISQEDLAKIIQTKYKKLSEVSDVLVLLHQLLASRTENVVSLQKRIPSTRDVFKLCRRLSASPRVMVNSVAFCKEVDDCFLCSSSSLDEYLKAALNVGEILGLSQERMHHILTLAKPDLDVSESYVRIGRVTMSRDEERKGNVDESIYALTRHVLVLMERLGACVAFAEPVLLVGETGTGKTTAIQHLANLLGKRLYVVNMSQQMDSGDLIGGFKPVGLKSVFSRAKEDFFSLFEKNFSLKRNNQFLIHIQNSFAQSKWNVMLKLMNHTCDIALEKAKGTTALLSEWKSLKNRLSKLDKQVKDQNTISIFSFIEGKLVQAIKTGSWILLDEINLATSDALESLCGILSDSHQTLLLTEKGDLKPVEAHPNFRLFACMNPATDVGKKSLPLGIRNRFTEIFVTEPSDEDLKLLVAKYLETFTLSPGEIESIVALYRNLKHLAENKLTDSNGHCPQYSLRTLCRALTFAARLRCGSIARSLFEGFSVSFLSQLDSESFPLVKQKIVQHLVPPSTRKALNSPMPRPSSDDRSVCVQGYWLMRGTKELSTPENYILTPSIEFNLKNLARVVCARYPVLLQGPTSVGKTSLIQYLASRTGNACIRINNHEHTDLQEYVGSYQPDEHGKLVFKEGPLVNAMKRGHWIILDELNLAPTDVLEALNRVLDDNRELFVSETQEYVKAKPGFILFATQNPPGQYAGRKMLSRAFRNRFVELHFAEIPHDEMGRILHKRCSLPLSHAKKMINVMKDLRANRRSSSVFAGKDGLITLRDLFRWGERYKGFHPDGKTYDWELHLAADGYFLLAGRVRNVEEEAIIFATIQKHFRGKFDANSLFGLSSNLSDLKNLNPLSADVLSKVQAHLQEKNSHVVLTKTMRRAFVLIGRAIANREPVLLIGETGSGKTTACEIYASLSGLKLFTVNCHMHTEAADFLGGLRPVRHHNDDDLSSSKLFEWCDGPLVEAMQSGGAFLVDEISLADDSVLERLNSVLEPERKLLLAERTWTSEGRLGEEMELEAADDFRIFATMNPGGDFGKKELSAALRNRFTEIWFSSCDSREELLLIVEKSLNLQLQILPVSRGRSGIGERIIDFWKFWTEITTGKRYSATVRDLLSWVEFINTCSLKALEPISTSDAYLHGACLVFMDSLETGSNFANSEEHCLLKKACVDFLTKQLPIDLSSILDKAAGNALKTTESLFGIGSFFLRKGSNKVSMSDDYSFCAPTAFRNVFRLLRGIQLNRPILLEGSPGVGKTSLVSALAKASGNAAVRINLSEETDIADLFGSDLPIEGGKSGEFRWRDGPLLRALKAGHWIILDELNLASQSVLEGLNACFDHRAEIFVPELGLSFQVKHERTRIFACQNPVQQGGNRKSLPKSFLDRMTKVFFEEFTKDDLLFIAKSAYPLIPVSDVEKMVDFLYRLSQGVLTRQSSGSLEFNLRDLLRWCSLLSKQKKQWGPAQFIDVIFSSKLNISNKKQVDALAAEIFGNSISVFRSHFRVTPTSVEIGTAKLKRRGCYVGLESPFVLLHSHMRPFHALAQCLDMGWMALLVGPSGCGKRSLVRILAQLTGSRLLEMPMTSDMGILELLGGFEQEDLNRDFNQLCEKGVHLLELGIEALARGGLLLERRRSLGDLLKIHCVLTKAKDDRCVDLEFGGKIAEKAATLFESLHLEQAEEARRFRLELEKFTKKTSGLKGNVGSRGGRFEWIDSFVVQAVKEGHWLLLDNANLCSPSVLDRLNPLLEEGGELKITERGVVDDEIVTVKPHPDFRLILSMDPVYGELSRAVRNRGLEIYVENDNQLSQSDIEVLQRSAGIYQPKLLQWFSALCDNLSSANSLRKLSRFFTTAMELIQREFSPIAAAEMAMEKVLKTSYDAVSSEIPVETPRPITVALSCPSFAEMALNSSFATARRDLSFISYLISREELYQTAVRNRVSWFAPTELVSDFSLAFTAILLFVEKSDIADWEIRMNCATSYVKDHVKSFEAIRRVTKNFVAGNVCEKGVPFNCLTDPGFAFHSDVRQDCDHSSLHQYLLWRILTKKEYLSLMKVSFENPSKGSIMALCLSPSLTPQRPWLRRLAVVVSKFEKQMFDYLRRPFSINCSNFLEVEMELEWFWKMLSFCCLSPASDSALSQLPFYWSKFRDCSCRIFSHLRPTERASLLVESDCAALDSAMDYGKKSLSSQWAHVFGSPLPYRWKESANVIVDLDVRLRYGPCIPRVVRGLFASRFLANLVWPKENETDVSGSEIIKNAQVIVDSMTQETEIVSDVRDTLSTATAILLKARLIAVLTFYIRGGEDLIEHCKEIVVLLSTLVQSLPFSRPFLYAACLRLEEFLHRNECNEDLLLALFGEIQLAFHDQLYFFGEIWSSLEAFSRIVSQNVSTFTAVENQSSFAFCFNDYLESSSGNSLSSIDQTCSQLQFLAKHFWSRGYILNSPVFSFRQSLWSQVAADFAGLLRTLNAIPTHCKQAYKTLVDSAEQIVETSDAETFLGKLASSFIRQSPRGAIELSRDVSSLLSYLLDCFGSIFAANRIDVDMAGEFSTLGKVTAVFGLLQSSLALPDVLTDLVEKNNWEIRQIETEIVSVETELATRHAQDSILCGRSSFPDLSEKFNGIELAGSPQLEAILLEKRNILQQDANSLRKSAACRPETSQFLPLVEEMKQFTQTIGSPSSVLSLINRLENLSEIDHILKRKSLLEEAAIWEKSAELFLHRLQETYPMYRDITVPFALGISKVIHGTKMLCTSSKKTRIDVLSLESLAYESDVVSAACCFADQAYSKDLNLSENRIRLVDLALQLFSWISQHKSSLSSRALESLNRLLETCHGVWRDQQSIDLAKTVAAAELFRYRESTRNDDESDDENDDESTILFPQYDDFADLIDEESLEPAKKKKKKKESSSSDSNAVSFEISDAHRAIFCSLASSLWTWTLPRPSSTMKEDVLAILFQRRYALLSRYGDFMQGLNLDGKLASSHSLFSSLKLRNYTLEPRDEASSDQLPDGLCLRSYYDIYHDSNIPAVRSILPILKSFCSRVKEILVDLPDNPVMIQLLDIVDKIKSFSLSNSIMKFLTGLELLLEKSQAWEMYSERRFHLSREIQSVMQVVVQWRKLELSRWPQLVEALKKRYAERASTWWYHLRTFVTSAATGDHQQIDNLVSAVQHFLESSSVGEFQFRLGLVYAYHCELIVLKASPAAQGVLYHLHRYYEQFREAISSHICVKKKPIEKEIKDFIKLFKWSESNFFALKDNIAKVREKLRHFAKNVEQILNEPVENFFSIQSLPTVNTDSNSKNQILPCLPSESLAKSSFELFHFKKLSSHFLTIFPKVVREARQCCSSLVLREKEVEQEIDVLDCITTLKSLQTATEQEEAKNAPAMKRHARQKRIALTSLFRSLKAAGLSYQRGVQRRKESDFRKSLLKLQPVDLTSFVLRMKAFSSGLLSEDAEKSISESWATTSALFYQCLVFDKALLSSFLKPSKDLVPLDIERMNGYSGQLLEIIIAQLGSIGDATKHIAKISDHLGSLRGIKNWIDELKVSPSLPLPLQKDTLQWMIKLKDLLDDVVLSLGEICLLFRCYPFGENEEMATDDPVKPAYARTTSASLVEEQRKKLETLKEEFLRQKSQLDERLLPLLAASNPVLLSWTQYEQMRMSFAHVEEKCADLTDIINTLQGNISMGDSGGLLAPLLTTRVRVASTCEEYRVWCTENGPIDEKCIDESHLQRLQERALSLLEIVSEICPVLRQSIQLGDSQSKDDFPVVDLLHSRPFSLLKAFELEKVSSTFVELVSNLSSWASFPLASSSQEILNSGVVLILSLLPLLDDFLTMAFSALSDAVLSQRFACTVFRDICTVFSDLLIKGYGHSLEDDSDGVDRGVEDTGELEGSGQPGDDNDSGKLPSSNQKVEETPNTEQADKDDFEAGGGQTSLDNEQEDIEMDSDFDMQNDDDDLAEDGSKNDSGSNVEDEFGETGEGDDIGDNPLDESDDEANDRATEISDENVNDLGLDAMKDLELDENTAPKDHNVDESVPQANDNEDEPVDSNQEEMSIPENLALDEDGDEAEALSSDDDVANEPEEAQDSAEDTQASLLGKDVDDSPDGEEGEVDEKSRDDNSASNQPAEGDAGLTHHTEDAETSKEQRDASSDDDHIGGGVESENTDRTTAEENQTASYSYSTQKSAGSNTENSIKRSSVNASLSKEPEPNAKRLKLAQTDEKIADSQAIESKSEEYTHVVDDSEKHDDVSLAAATEQQAREQKLSVESVDEETAEERNVKADDDKKDSSIGDPAQENSFEDGQRKAYSDVKLTAESDNRSIDESGDGEISDKSKRSLVKFRQNVDWMHLPSSEQLEARLTSRSESSTKVSSDAQLLWRQYEQLTSNHARELCEQLRLVLEPTLSTRLRGDYRSGKRLNMKKIIPYIASGFRRDKIWLRRTKPSKRQYQIMLAVDDSSSMGSSHCKQMAFEALSIVSNALRWLEVGQFGICSFGETTSIVQSLVEPFTSESGGRVLQEFAFDQNKTKVAQMVNTCVDDMIKYDHHLDRNQARSRLLLIVSDGRGIFLEGTEVVKAAARRAQLAGVVTVFIILDSLKNKDSVLDIVVPVFDDKAVPRMLSYMDEFPFPFYILLKDISDLPRTLSDALRQWFEGRRERRKRPDTSNVQRVRTYVRRWRRPTGRSSTRGRQPSGNNSAIMATSFASAQSDSST
ncbi:midasin-like isoform X3 [Oscarella lobularis]|uniref:midasin-like isoform X3 n=1 Tax=Oscarella lobularis TaxID=121494 RepID=UPI0033133888